jgi:membrane protease YdiL (CAAX protease family)
VRGDAVRRFIRSLSPSAEFAVVVLGAFGYFVVISLAAVFHADPQAGQLSDRHLLVLLAYELVLLLLLLGFLRLRGWTVDRFDIRLTAGETLAGFGLAGVAYLAYILVFVVVAAAWPQAAQATQTSVISSSGISLATVIAVSFINPAFEEIFVCGYVIAALQKSGDTWAGVHVSVAIRLLYHLYQGAIAVIGVVPIGLIFALWYRRTGRLWPVIVAHAVTDFAALLHFVR